MTYSPGDPGHIQAHVDLVTDVNAQADRFGLADDLPLRGVGDEGHLDDHNAIRAKLELIETTAGQAYTTPLPPVRNLGDPGHVDDHNKLADAVLEAATWPAWNDATGGTITTVDNYGGSGEKWRIHRFDSSGSLDISRATQPFRVLIVGGGGGGGGMNGNSHGGGGSGGYWVHNTRSLTVGAHAVTIGAGGGAAHYEWEAFAGKQSALGAITANGGAGGTPLSNNTGATNGGGSNITGSNKTYGQGAPSNNSYVGAANTGNGGGGGTSGSAAGRPGGSGIVVVAYRIG